MKWENKTFKGYKVEDMCLRVKGTIGAPTEPILSIGKNQVALTQEKAKEFIQKVLKGEQVYSEQRLGNLRIY